LDSGGVLLSSENSLDRTGKTATAERLKQPVRVIDLKRIVDIQKIKGRKESVDVHTLG
jgi:hypothetical protein